MLIMVGWISDIISGLGYGGLVLLMFLEGAFSPVPAEIVMPLAGFAAARGDLSLPSVILAGTAGSVLGALPWYLAGRLFGKKRLKSWADRYERWLTISSSDIDKAFRWFDRHGNKAVFLGRLVPTVRTVMSVAAGFACMHPVRFLIYSTTGTLLWSGLLAWVGYLLQSHYHVVAYYVGPVSSAIVVVILLSYLYRVITYHPPRGPRR